MTLHKKLSVKLFCLVFLASLTTVSLCSADDDEVEGEPQPQKAYSLGQERTKPKPKVIIKEKIVEKMVCPNGSNWNADVKKCQDEDGNNVVVTAKPKKRQQAIQEDREPVTQTNRTRIPDEKYIYPRTKVRVRAGQCIMTDESMTCDISYINTSPGKTHINADPKTTFILDNLGNKFFRTSAECSNYCMAAYGEAVKHSYKFTYLDTKATSLTLSVVIKANGETDLIKLENFEITK